MNLGQILAKVWELLGQTPSSTVFSRTNLVRDINEVLRTILKGSVVSLISPGTKYLSTRLSFNEGIITGNVSPRLVITKELNAGDSEIFLETSSISNMGKLLIQKNVFEYVSKQVDRVILLAPSTVSLMLGSVVRSATEAPEDMMMPIEYIIENKDGEFITSLPLADEYKYSVYYDIETIGNTSYIVSTYSGQISNIWVLRYHKKLTELIDNEDICILPDGYSLSVLANIVAGKNALVTGLPMGQQLLNLGYSSLQEMYSFFDRKNKPRKTSIKPISYFSKR